MSAAIEREPSLSPADSPRAVRLTLAQLCELDLAIARQEAFVMDNMGCLFTIDACGTQNCVLPTTGMPGAHLDGVMEFFDGDVVRMVRPTLDDLLDARKRAILKI